MYIQFQMILSKAQLKCFKGIYGQMPKGETEELWVLVLEYYTSIPRKYPQEMPTRQFPLFPRKGKVTRILFMCVN